MASGLNFACLTGSDSSVILAYLAINGALHCIQVSCHFTSDSSVPTKIREKIYRLNADVHGDYVAIDNYKKMKEMEQMVARQMEPFNDVPSPLAQQITKIADILTASLFFFEPNQVGTNDRTFDDTRSPDGNHEIRGTIRCRLARKSQELKQLVNLVRGFSQREVRRTSTGIEETDRSPIEVTESLRNVVRQQGGWFRVQCTIRTSDPVNAQLVLAVKLHPPKDEQLYYHNTPVPISGFPVSFENLEKRSRLAW